MHTNYRGLAFLLSIGSLPFACSKEDNDTDSGSTTTPGTSPTDTGDATTDPTTGNTMSSDPTTTGASDSDTTTGASDSGTTTAGMTTLPGTNTDTGVETEGMPPMPTDPTCIAYAQHFVECVPRYAAYELYAAVECEYTKANALRSDGQPCADAFEAYYVCFTKLDCAVIQEDMGGCATEQAAIDAACPNFGNDGGSEGGSSGG